MIRATVTLESTSPYSQSRKHDTDKKAKETHDAYDQRTWREHATFSADGHVVIPQMAFKFALMSAAQYLSERVPEKGMKTWTQYFTSAIQITDDLPLPYTRETMESVTISAHANGNRKSGKRVTRMFPIYREWKGQLTVFVMDPTITKEIFVRVFEHAGMFIGIGRFRPENGGFNGRFRVVKVKWENADALSA